VQSGLGLKTCVKVVTSEWGQAWVWEGNASEEEVISSRHGEAKVTMATTTTSRWDSAHIGINFLGEEFEGQISWHPSELG